MQYFDYKVVSAPGRSKKSKGVREPSDLYALTLTDTINEHAREGWEYVRAETLVTKTPRGLFKRATDDSVAVLVFRRERRNLEPRLETANTHQQAPAAITQVEPAVITAPSQAAAAAEAEQSGRRDFADRIQRATGLNEQPEDQRNTPPSPLRPGPTLGPADRS